MNKLSLFSGIGGDDLASEWAGIKTVCFVEKDKYCQQVLKKHWPDTPIIEEVKDVTKAKVMDYASQREDNGRERGDLAKKARNGERGNPTLITGSQDGIGIDIISGGFPCQPHSVAGKRKGSGDERNLWPEFRRVIGEIKPRWVVAENVPGLLSSKGSVSNDRGGFFREILRDLSSLGYTVGWCTYGAIDVGAPHRRDRVFIVAYSEQLRNRGWRDGDEGRGVGALQIERPSTGRTEILADAPECNNQPCGPQPNQRNAQGCCKEMADPELQGQPDNQRGGTYEVMDGTAMLDRSGRENREAEYWSVEPDVGRVAHGVPHRVDRLRALGNAVVPQQIYPIYKAIMDWEEALR